MIPALFRVSVKSAAGAAQTLKQGNLVGVKTTLTAAVVLGIIWFLLSGHTSGLMLGLGFASCALTLWLSSRLGLVNQDGVLSNLRLIALSQYGVWLIVEIVKANWDVAKRIVTPGASIDPVIITVLADQQTDVGRVIHANSITLTPGTLSMRVSESDIEVHALSRAAASDLQGGEIGRRVSALEAPAEERSDV